VRATKFQGSIPIYDEPRVAHSAQRSPGFSDLLADERYGTLNDRQQRYVLTHIHTGGTHLLKLITDILTFPRLKRAEWRLSVKMSTSHPHLRKCSAPPTAGGQEIAGIGPAG